MRLTYVTVQKYRNFVDAQRIEIEQDVTCLVGKNESGKTTILEALQRLNPANGSNPQFNLTTDYPRWRLARDRRKDDKLAKLQPVKAEFTLDKEERNELAETFGCVPPSRSVLYATRNYDNELVICLRADVSAIVDAAAADASVAEDDMGALRAAATMDEVLATAKSHGKNLKDSGEDLRAKAVAAFGTAVAKYKPLLGIDVNPDQTKALAALLPRFFYFSSYYVLPGETNLTTLAHKVAASQGCSDAERTVLALLSHAGEEPKDFLDDDYVSRKAELQAASVDLSQRVFEYWTQNPDLSVVFDTDNVVMTSDPAGNQTANRFLKIELRDGRHGDVETNFSTRSTGFQWFFSFFAAFSEYQDSDESIIVLLDEPGMSLHGEAQRDFVRFIYNELGAAKQVLYTTHSQHMVDPTKYEKLRAVHDRATRQNPDQAVIVTKASFSADRATILPIESALGYSIAQHLFIGSGHHLAVEGSADFTFLLRLSEYLVTRGKTGLDPRLAIIPVGGADNMPAFVALLGRRLKVSALIDGARTGAKISRVKKAALDNGVSESSIVAVSQVNGSPTNADIEDLFEPDDYLKLYNWAYGTSLTAAALPASGEPIVKKLTDLRGDYNHAEPATALTEHLSEFFGNVHQTTLDNFEELFGLLNATLGT
jgi:energy-coupling factor transporter ATP-binding protein EcfA2